MLSTDVEPITVRVADVRPSDGINLALRLGAPIRVNAAAFGALRPADERPVEWL